jgi:hypothetical protein
MLAEFLQGNHLLKSLATVPWLWKAKGPAHCGVDGLRHRHDQGHKPQVFIRYRGINACGLRPLDEPGAWCRA